MGIAGESKLSASMTANGPAKFLECASSGDDHSRLTDEASDCNGWDMGSNPTHSTSSPLDQVVSAVS